MMRYKINTLTQDIHELSSFHATRQNEVEVERIAGLMEGRLRGCLYIRERQYLKVRAQAFYTLARTASAAHIEGFKEDGRVRELRGGIRILEGKIRYKERENLGKRFRAWKIGTENERERERFVGRVVRGKGRRGLRDSFNLWNHSVRVVAVKDAIALRDGMVGQHRNAVLIRVIRAWRRREVSRGFRGLRGWMRGGRKRERGFEVLMANFRRTGERRRKVRVGKAWGRWRGWTREEGRRRVYKERGFEGMSRVFDNNIMHKKRSAWGRMREGKKRGNYNVACRILAGGETRRGVRMKLEAWRKWYGLIRNGREITISSLKSKAVAYKDNARRIKRVRAVNLIAIVARGYRDGRMGEAWGRWKIGVLEGRKLEIERGLKVGMITRMLAARGKYRRFQTWKENVYGMQERERERERR